MEKFNCSDFETSEVSRSKIRTCSEDEFIKPNLKNAKDLAKVCGFAIGEEAAGIWNGLKKIPHGIANNFNKSIETVKASQEFCTKFLGLKESPFYEDRMNPSKTTIDWDACVSRKISEAHHFSLPSLSQIKPALEKVFQSSQCFKPESVIKVVCPIVASVMVGALEGYALKRALIYFANRAALTGAVASAEVETAASNLKKTANSAKEALSVSHQMDLVVATESYGGKKAFANLGMNLRQTQLGIMASDAGKIVEVWSEKILTPSAASDEVLKVLSGQSQSVAGKALNEIFAQSGMKGKSLLNGDLSPAALRSVFEKNPRLMTGYLHELPGLADSIATVNSGLMSVSDFQSLVSASLFHNGPNAGFWKFMGDELVPQMLGDSGDEVTKKFFKNTVFEGATNSKGVIVPNYPSPVSKEGVFHTVVDRLSQASRGGFTKIYMEMGNPSGKKGLETLNELLIKNPKGTIEQLQALDTHIGKMGGLVDKERKGLSSITNDAISRLQLQQKFYSVNYNNGLMDIQYRQWGQTQFIHLSEKSSAEDIYEALNKVMAAEEKANKEPLSTFIKSSFGPAVARPAMLGLADLPLVCAGRPIEKTHILPPSLPTKTDSVQTHN